MTPKPKMGRPRRAKKESAARLVARVTEAEFEAASKVAKFRSQSLSEFVRDAVAREVRSVNDARQKHLKELIADVKQVAADIASVRK